MDDSIFFYMASKWNWLGCVSLSLRSSLLSLQWKRTMTARQTKQVPTRASPVSAMPREGVMNSLASHREGESDGCGITYIWELGMI